MKNDLMYHVQMGKQQDIEDLKADIKQLKEESNAIRMGLDEHVDKSENQLAEMQTNYDEFKRQIIKRKIELQRGLQFTLLAVLIGYVLGVGTILL
jgi:septal ring factor EnvC (AmiA/AmiB activator)